MKKIVLIFNFLIIIISASAQQADSSVAFKYNIGWDLFKGVPDSDTLGARITSSIYLETAKINIWTGAITFKACAIMNPYKSWVKPDYADNYTLQHEQTHFNITELCSRGLQNELNKMKLKSKNSPLIKSSFEKWEKKMEDLQSQYDFETEGGNAMDSQKMWNEKVIADL